MTASPFLFGKLPAHGDFVARGLSDAAREAWDAWSSAALAALREAAGDGFEDAHDAAPPWRFVAGPDERLDEPTVGDQARDRAAEGALGPASAAGWMAGALAPSVDLAGRRYLLALGLDGLSARQAGGCGLSLAAEAEALIYTGLAETLSADALAGLAADRLVALRDAGAQAAEALAAVPSAPGVWWTLGSQTSPPLAFGASAPPPDLFIRTILAAPEFAR